MIMAAKDKKKTSRTRPIKYKVKPLCQHSKDILNLNLNRIVRELEVVRTKNGGRITYGSITTIVLKMQPVLPWLTKDMIQNELRKPLNAGQLDDCTRYCQGITNNSAQLLCFRRNTPLMRTTQIKNFQKPPVETIWRKQKQQQGQS
jgi:hypothetical protein